MRLKKKKKREMTRKTISGRSWVEVPLSEMNTQIVCRLSFPHSD